MTSQTPYDGIGLPQKLSSTSKPKRKKPRAKKPEEAPESTEKPENDDN